MLFAQKEADREFREKQQLKAQKMKDDCKGLQDVHIQQMVRKFHGSDPEIHST